MIALQKIVIGKTPLEGNEAYSYSKGMRVISASLLEHGNELQELWGNRDSAEFKKIAPVCTRIILEQSMAALLGRIDPIRFVAIYKGSHSSDFKIGERNASSFNWSKDAIPTDLKIKHGSYWTQDSLGKGIIRSILDGHVADYVFTSAHELAVAAITDATQDKQKLPSWLIRFTQFDEKQSQAILNELRIKASTAYSSLSKGIHFEFFGGDSTKPEANDITESIRNAIIVIATSGMYINFSDIALNKISDNEARDSFIDLVEFFLNE
ncbi:hypothetical protein [Leptothrix ochracea]|uniref:hypothetical protein n=1 Tax=Leptothrix ochracea TaxID=735331 RepID=UPI0034E2719E